MKKKRKNKIVMYRLVYCFFAFISISISSCNAQPRIGTSAGNISLPNFEGKNINLSSLKGKVVLIDFWASWCRPCRQTVPALKKLYNLYHDKGFEIYGVSLDKDKNAWQTAVSQDQSAWIHVNDNAGTIAARWDISFIPATFLLDKEGKIITTDEDEKKLNKIIKQLLN